MLSVWDRYHTVQEFNMGVYDYIIATDESGANEEVDVDQQEIADNTLVEREEECMWPFTWGILSA
jgi:ATP-dependent RNA helicase DDX56/DBP9